MAIETRRITRMATAVDYRNRFGRGGQIPAWRLAMVNTDTVYSIGQPNSTLESLIVFPHGGSECPALWGENEIETVNQHGWTGVVHAQDASTYGKLLNQSAGEFSIPSNVQAFNLDDGTWSMWQQPVYALNQAGAAAIGGDMYYSPTEYAALPSNSKAYPDVSAWDGVFPVGFNQWIWWRKALTLSSGSDTTYFNRYNSSSWLPASMTGLGAGARVVNEDTLCGPGGNGRIGSTDAGWYDASRLWPSGTVKFYVRWQNTVTKARGVFPVPNPEAVNGSDIYRNASIVDVASKRLYYFGNKGGLYVYYYDLSGGIAGATVSAVIPLTIMNGSSDFGLARGSRVFTNGHPTGKRLLYFWDASQTNALFMVDLDTAEHWRLAITGLNINPPEATNVGMGYRSSDNKLILTTNGVGQGPRSHTITIPSDPTVAANYSVVNTQLTIDPSAVIESGIENPYMYGWGTYIDDPLGVVISHQFRGRLLAYRPA